MASFLELLSTTSGGSGGYSTAAGGAAAFETGGGAAFAASIATQALATAVVGAAKVRRYVHDCEQRALVDQAMRELSAANAGAAAMAAAEVAYTAADARVLAGYVAGVGSAALAWRFRAAPTHLRNWWFASRGHCRYGHAAPCDVVLRRQGYAVGYRYDLKAPVWASMVVCGRSSVAAERRTTNPFALDPQVDAKHQSAPDAYTNSGWDRGHIAPRAAVAFSTDASDESFYMTNIAPQHPALNRGAWSRLERQVRKWAQTRGPLAVVVGPVFHRSGVVSTTNGRASSPWWSPLAPLVALWPTGKSSVDPSKPPTLRRLGGDGAAIPDGFFMAVTSVRQPSKTIAFYFDNSAAAADAVKGADLVADVAISVDALELATHGSVNVFRNAPWWRRPSKTQRRLVDREFWANDKGGV